MTSKKELEVDPLDFLFHRFHWLHNFVCESACTLHLTSTIIEDNPRDVGNDCANIVQLRSPMGHNQVMIFRMPESRSIVAIRLE